MTDFLTVGEVAARSGVPVAKHGNRAMSSRTGAADVLEVLGIPINHDAAAAKKYLEKPGFAFLFAPAYHPAMKYVGGVRKELGFRGAFIRPQNGARGLFPQRRCDERGVLSR